MRKGKEGKKPSFKPRMENLPDQGYIRSEAGKISSETAKTD